MNADENYLVTDMTGNGTLTSPPLTKRRSSTGCIEVNVAKSSILSTLGVYLQFSNGALGFLYQKSSVPVAVHRINFLAENSKKFKIVVHIHDFMAIKSISLKTVTCSNALLNCTSYDIPCDWICRRNCKTFDGYKFTPMKTSIPALIMTPLIPKHQGKKCLKIISEETKSSGYITTYIQAWTGRRYSSRTYTLRFRPGGTELSKLDITTPGDFHLIVKFRGKVTIEKILFEDKTCWNDRLINCTFDDKNDPKCGWHTVDTQKGWALQLGSILPPGKDHLPGKPSGHIMAFIRQQNGNSSQKLVSDEFYRHQHSCFRFWYFMSKSSSQSNPDNSLTVGYTLKNKDSTLLTIRGSTDNYWMVAETNVKLQTYSRHTGTYYIWFKSNVLGSEGIIAVDDTMLIPGTCEAQDKDCTFENGFCTWSNHNLNDEWRLVKAGNIQLTKLPKRDHTTGSLNGNYLILKPHPGRKVQATLRSIVYQPQMSQFCIRFWQISPGGKNERDITIYQCDVATNKKKQIFTSNKIHSNWTSVSSSLSSTTKPFYIEIYGDLMKASQTGIGLDDFSFLSVNEEHCDFEANGWCGWKKTSILSSWNRLAASQISLNRDMKPGTPTGHLLAWDSHQYYKCSADVIESPLMKFCSQTCLEIWLFLDKDDYVQVVIGYEVDGTKNPLSFHSGTSGKFWEAGMFDIPATEYKLYIEPSTLSPDSCIGLIAFDNIKIKRGKCPKEKASCDFENGLCMWTSSVDYGYWKTVQALSNSIKGSPKRDHTLRSNKGHYLFLNPQSKLSNGHGYVNASLYSINQASSEKGRCLLLWIISPSNSNTVTINLVIVVTRQPKPLQIIKTSANSWTQMKINIPQSDDDYYLELVGAVKSSSKEGIAIDDITISENSCN